MKNEKEIIKYECLNVAEEVVFIGTAPECLAFYDEGENSNIVNAMRQLGTDKVYPACFWLPMARLVKSVLDKREDKKRKKEDRKNAK